MEEYVSTVKTEEVERKRIVAGDPVEGELEGGRSEEFRRELEGEGCGFGEG